QCALRRHLAFQPGRRPRPREEGQGRGQGHRKGHPAPGSFGGRLRRGPGHRTPRRTRPTRHRPRHQSLGRPTSTSGPGSRPGGRPTRAGPARSHHRGRRRHRGSHRPRSGGPARRPHHTGHRQQSCTAGTGRPGGGPARRAGAHAGHPRTTGRGRPPLPRGGAALSTKTTGTDPSATGGPPPGTELLPTATAKRTWAVLGAGVRDIPWATVLALGTVLAGSAAGLVAPWVLGQMVDDISAGAGTDTIVRSAALIAGAAVVGGVLVGLGAWQVGRVGEIVLARLRERVMERVLHMRADHVERVRIGDLLSRVGDDVAVVTNAIARNGPEVVTALAVVLLTTAGMSALDWRLGLAGLVALPFYIRALFWYLPRSGPYYARERVAMGERSHALMGALRGRDTVRAHRLEQEHEHRIAERSRTAMQLTQDVFGLFTRLGARMNGSEVAGLGAVLVVGFFLVRGDLATVGMVTAAALYFHRLFGPLGFLVMNFNDVQQAGASLARLAGVIDLPVSQDPNAEEGPNRKSTRLNSS